MSIARHHAEWLSLLDIVGSFLSMEVLLEVFAKYFGLSAGIFENGAGDWRALAGEVGAATGNDDA